jgi:hypothetical protein
MGAVERGGVLCELDGGPLVLREAERERQTEVELEAVEI